jgi:hypothetical protein
MRNCKVLSNAEKKRPPAAGIGRRKGVPNRISGDVRRMIEGALHEAGGQAYLTRQATENPVAFLSLLGKILPREVKAEVAATNVVPDLTPEHQRAIAEAILRR